MELFCDVVHRTRIKNQARDTLSRLETQVPDKTRLDDDIPKLVESFVQRINPHSDEEDSSLADGFCVWEKCNVSVVEFKDSLTEKATINQTNGTYKAKDKLDLWEMSIKNKLKRGNFNPM